MLPQQARPIRSENRATLVASIARGRRWLDELVAEERATTDSIARRERCSVRKVNMTISLAFLAPISLRPPSTGGSRMGWELPASPTCQPNGPASTRCSALPRSSGNVRNEGSGGAVAPFRKDVRRPYLRLLVSQPKEPRSIPPTASDGERDLREAGIGLAVPREAGTGVCSIIPKPGESGAARLGFDPSVAPSFGPAPSWAANGTGKCNGWQC